MRTLVATLVVPVVVVSGILLPGAFGSEKVFEDTTSMIMGTLFNYLFALAFTVAVVLPLRFMWRRWDFMRGWVSTTIGAALGVAIAISAALVFASVPALSTQPIGFAEYLRIVSMLGLTGAAAGLAFWLIAHSEMRPNNSLERSRER